MEWLGWLLAFAIYAIAMLIVLFALYYVAEWVVKVIRKNERG